MRTIDGDSVSAVDSESTWRSVRDCRKGGAQCYGTADAEIDCGGDSGKAVRNVDRVAQGAAAGVEQALTVMVEARDCPAIVSNNSGNRVDASASRKFERVMIPPATHPAASARFRTVKQAMVPISTVSRILVARRIDGNRLIGDSATTEVQTDRIGVSQHDDPRAPSCTGLTALYLRPRE